MNGKELLIMIEKKRDTMRKQQGKIFKCRRCRKKSKANYLLDYPTT